MASGRMNYSHKNPAVKRIMQEIRELQGEDSPDFKAEAIEDNIFEWHFVFRGPPETEFEGGLYHGRILLPSEYPFKPPEFIMLTPNGRWETGTKICLSISAHHPEHWQPSWSVRTALMALKTFMASPGNGAIGSLDFPKAERERLAVRSCSEPPKFGTAERQDLIRDIHQKMLAANLENKQNSRKIEQPTTQAALRSEANLGPNATNTDEPSGARELIEVASEIERSPEPLLPATPPIALTATQSVPQVQETEQNVQLISSGWEERGLNYLAVALLLAIIAILGRKALASIDIADFA